MITLLSTLVALWLIGLVMLAIGSWRAPEGFEDAAGFHFGDEDRRALPVAVVAASPVAGATAAALPVSNAAGA